MLWFKFDCTRLWMITYLPIYSQDIILSDVNNRAKIEMQLLQWILVGKVNNSIFKDLNCFPRAWNLFKIIFHYLKATATYVKSVQCLYHLWDSCTCDKPLFWHLLTLIWSMFLPIFMLIRDEKGINSLPLIQLCLYCG